MVIVRRSVSVLMALWAIAVLFRGCQATVTWLSLPPTESCVASSPSLGTWLGSGLVLLVASVIWFAPWSRFTQHRPRIRLLTASRPSRRLGRIWGWSLIALGIRESSRQSP